MVMHCMSGRVWLLKLASHDSLRAIHKTQSADRAPSIIVFRLVLRAFMLDGETPS